MSTLHLLLKLQRLFSVNIEDETFPIHAWSTGQLQLRNAVLGMSRIGEQALWALLSTRQLKHSLWLLLIPFIPFSL